MKTIPWPETILQELVNNFTVKTKREKHLWLLFLNTNLEIWANTL